MSGVVVVEVVELRERPELYQRAPLLKAGGLHCLGFYSSSYKGLNKAHKKLAQAVVIGELL